MQKAIIVKNLTKKFKDFTAVDNISFEVSPGEIFAFLGPNGAGKTTTIKMLTTLLHPTSGEILLDGHDVNKDQDSARKSFGIVFQDPSLDDELTAYENMKFHAMLYRVPSDTKKIKDLLEFVELLDRKDALVKTFSGGMKRRLEIARGLLHHPKIFFLDEPTQGLDPQTRNHLWEYLINLAKKDNITIFFTTHYMEEAQNTAQKIAIIDHGKIIKVGTTEQILKDTKTNSLEKAFLKLTGNSIRDEDASGADRMRQHRAMFRGR
ncbi:MAG TPA: ATP-binding cassette domain-containing protein [Patescibacteria group bacterium]